jgi:hypothetical protein
MNFYGQDVMHRNGGRFHVPIDDSATSRPQEMMAEYGLVEAVLREAIREYQKCAGQRGRRSSRLFREVHQWFSEDDRKWDFSFINVCQILDLEPTYIRTGLKIWSDRNVGAIVVTEPAKTRTKRRRHRENPAPVGSQTLDPRYAQVPAFSRVT